MTDSTRREPPARLPGQADLRTVTGRPSSARLADCLLGGKDNYEVDRQLADDMTAVAGFLPQSAVENRQFTQRAVAVLALRGLDQYLDIGCGMPAVIPVHAAAAWPGGTGVRVVYVDHDPIVMAHSRALLTARSPSRVGHLLSDLANTEDILTADEVTGVLDLSRPVAVILHAVLQELPDATAYAAVQTLAASLPSGSVLSITHPTSDTAPEPMRQAADLWQKAGLPAWTLRSRSDVTRFFTGWDLLSPGVVLTADWRPRPFIGPESVCTSYAGMAVKP
ncbi:SAM-dependent methyltransferase [Streptomyces sp. NPDC058256]|uniref:SAM-dependent methyltransferase n=1 Tax=Streptomyces sp. NPDC058256 TaxID=3346408 RepID=UPI0036EF8055